MLAGPRLQEVRAGALAASGAEVIYSGGIGALADLEGLAALRTEHGLERIVWREAVSFGSRGPSVSSLEMDPNGRIGWTMQKRSLRR